MKLLLLTHAAGVDMGKFADILARQTGAEVQTWRYDELAFWLDDEDTRVLNAKTGEDLADFDGIFVLSTPAHEKNHILNAVGCYARKRGVKMYDDEFANFSGKLWEMFCFWEVDVAVPKTAFGPVEFMVESLERLGGVGVLKSTHAAKGKDNYLVKSTEELRKILTENPETTYILQEFIPNTGDYRVLVFDYQPVMALYRHRNDTNEHRNNTSAGGAAEEVAITEIDAEALESCVRAAQAMHVRLAGADVVQNSETGKYYMLEVNRTPQIASGGWLEEKAAAVAKLLD